MVGATAGTIATPSLTGSFRNDLAMAQMESVKRGNSSMFRSNSFKENTDADYGKSKRVSANIMSQLLLDWLETRQNCVFDANGVRLLKEIWKRHYPDLGSKFI